MTDVTTTVASSADGLPTADTFLIEGNPCPGVVRITSINSPRGWDEQQGYGLDGATLIPRGNHLADITFEIRIWAGAQWTAWLSFSAQYFAKSVRFTTGSNVPRALGITYPVLNAQPWAIQSVVVADVQMSDPAWDDDNLYTISLKLKEYRPPVLAAAKPDQPIPPASQANPPPATQQQAAIALLSSENARRISNKFPPSPSGATP
jgi:hypothetical protein